MKRLTYYTILGICIVLITGTLAHFVYDWSGQHFLVALFFPVNESTWEHMKLLFFPLIMYSYFMNTRLKADFPCITSASLSGILAGTYLVPVLFYTYSGILGRNLLFLDIGTFVISVLFAFFIIRRTAIDCRFEKYKTCLKWFVLLTALCFFYFTSNPLHIGIFTDPT